MVDDYLAKCTATSFFGFKQTKYFSLFFLTKKIKWLQMLGVSIVT